MTRREVLDINRLRESRDTFLDSLEYMQKLSTCHEKQCDYFSAYFCLWIAFSNLYSLFSDFQRGRVFSEPEKIKKAVRMLSVADMKGFYVDSYVDRIEFFRQRKPWEVKKVGASHKGILNMQDYFLGNGFDQCVKHVEDIAGVCEEPEKKMETLVNVADKLLYTIRNNLFHTVKGSLKNDDKEVVQNGYLLLIPIVECLKQKASAYIDGIRSSAP